MKNLFVIIILFFFTSINSQNDVRVDAQNPRVISKISDTYGGFYHQYGSNVQGGLVYTHLDSTIRLSHSLNPNLVKDFTLKTLGAHVGHFGMGISPGQHYFSILHDSKRIAGFINHPNNTAHLALIEDDEDDFARIWFLNSYNDDRWAILGRTGINNDLSFAYNGSNRLRMNSNGNLILNAAITMPNHDGTNGQSLVTDGSGILYWDDVKANMADLDGDTQITVEETPDNDLINMYCKDSLVISLKQDSIFVPKGVFAGFGTTNPNNPIHIVAENNDEYAGITLEGGTGTKHVHCILDNRTANGKRYSMVSVGDDSSIPNGSFAIRDITLSIGVERFVIDTDGNVGIGTNTPQKLFHVNGDSKMAGTMHVTGNLGIGTPIPEEKLHVVGSSKIEGAMNITDSLVVGTGIGAKIYIGNDYFTDGGLSLIRAKANFTPTSTDEFNLGGGTFKWKNLFLSNKLKLGGSELYEEAAGNAIMSNNNFTPDIDNMYKLGVGTKRWSHIFAASGVVSTSDIRSDEA